MERETKKITTPISKQVVEFKTYITGREMRSISNSFIGGNLTFNVTDKDIKGLNPEMMDKKQDLTIGLIVMSVGGHKNGDEVEVTKADGTVSKYTFSVVDAVLDMQVDDYNAVMDVVSAIESGNDPEKKTQI